MSNAEKLPIRLLRISGGWWQVPGINEQRGRAHSVAGLRLPDGRRAALRRVARSRPARTGQECRGGTRMRLNREDSCEEVSAQFEAMMSEHAA